MKKINKLKPNFFIISLSIILAINLSGCSFLDSLLGIESKPNTVINEPASSQTVPVAPASTSAAILPAVTTTTATTQVLNNDYTRLADAELKIKTLVAKETDVGSLQGIKLSSPVSVFKAGSDKMNLLHSEIRAFIQANQLENANLAIVYQNIVTGERYSYNENKRFFSASCIKVPIAMVCAQLVERGLFTWDMGIANIPDEEGFIADDPLGFGDVVSLGELIQAALRTSNNTATSLIFSYFKRHGRELHFFIDDAMQMHYAKDVTMSAYEGAHVMEQLLNNPDRITGYAQILTELNHSTWNNYMTKNLPHELCANKYGQMNADQHEIGVVYTEEPYIYAVFSNNIDAYNIYPQLGTLLYEFNLNNQANLPKGPTIEPRPTTVDR